MKQAELVAAFVELARRQQDTIDRMQQTLDRIVTSRFDAPLVRTIHPVQPDQMPQWGLNDQADSAPNEIERGLAAISADSDAEFLAAVGAE